MSGRHPGPHSTFPAPPGLASTHAHGSRAPGALPSTSLLMESCPPQSRVPTLYLPDLRVHPQAALPPPRATEPEHGGYTPTRSVLPLRHWRYCPGDARARRVDSRSLCWGWGQNTGSEHGVCVTVGLTQRHQVSGICSLPHPCGCLFPVCVSRQTGLLFPILRATVPVPSRGPGASAACPLASLPQPCSRWHLSSLCSPAPRG